MERVSYVENGEDKKQCQYLVNYVASVSLSLSPSLYAAGFDILIN